MANYCDYTDIQVLLNQTFSDSTSSPTQPTAAQATEIISQVTGEIDVYLATVGQTTQPTDTSLLAYLKRFCSFGAAGIIAQTYGNNFQNVDLGQGNWYYREYKAFLENMGENPVIINGITGNTSGFDVSSNFYDGTTTEDDTELLNDYGDISL